MIEFHISNRARSTRVQFTRKGWVRIHTDLQTPFESMRPILVAMLTPPEIELAERLWCEDQVEREFKKGLFILRLRPKVAE